MKHFFISILFLSIVLVTLTSQLHTTSLATGYVDKSTNYTLTINDETVNATASGITFTLPTAVGISGRQYTIINSSSSDITVATTSSQLIGNYTTSTTLTIGSNSSYILKSNGASYKIIAKF